MDQGDDTDRPQAAYTEAETLAILDASCGQPLADVLARIPDRPCQPACAQPAVPVPSRPAIDPDEFKRRIAEAEAEREKKQGLPACVLARR